MTKFLVRLLKRNDLSSSTGFFCAEDRFSKGFVVSIDTSSIMSLVPIMGAAVTFVVFSLLMYACIRNVDQGVKKAAQDDGWGDEESVAKRRVGKPLS